jgi:hypothetical protein
MRKLKLTVLVLGMIIPILGACAADNIVGPKQCDVGLYQVDSTMWYTASGDSLEATAWLCVRRYDQVSHP